MIKECKNLFLWNDEIYYFNFTETSVYFDHWKQSRLKLKLTTTRAMTQEATLPASQPLLPLPDHLSTSAAPIVPPEKHKEKH